ncbi:hypothetical protein [Hydrogenophaga taeniospiralis]|uniref:hypothetical protein n=1 Tax=Hydrogenophaga taeniospiralis TaxID=65656 RepID=UPI0012F87BD5|nr:hypothetical protein [Hydrogenophaga taeniospiralis]
MDTITTNTSNSRPIWNFAPSQDVNPSAAAPPNSGIAKGMVQQATHAPATPNTANTGFFMSLLQWIHAGRFP